MAFNPKNWQNAPNTSTPISAAALQDLESRTTAMGFGGTNTQTNATYSAVAGDVVVGNPTSGGIAIALPLAKQSTTVTVFAGTNISASNLVTIVGASPIFGNGISGTNTFVLGIPGSSAIFCSDGTNWYIVGGTYGIDLAPGTSSVSATVNAGQIIQFTTGGLTATLPPTANLPVGTQCGVRSYLTNVTTVRSSGSVSNIILPGTTSTASFKIGGAASSAIVLVWDGSNWRELYTSGWGYLNANNVSYGVGSASIPNGSRSNDSSTIAHNLTDQYGNATAPTSVVCSGAWTTDDSLLTYAPYGILLNNNTFSPTNSLFSVRVVLSSTNTSGSAITIHFNWAAFA